jgi:hypothetical protein
MRFGFPILAEGSEAAEEDAPLAGGLESWTGTKGGTGVADAGAGGSTETGAVVKGEAERGAGEAAGGGGGRGAGCEGDADGWGLEGGGAGARAGAGAGAGTGAGAGAGAGAAGGGASSALAESWRASAMSFGSAERHASAWFSISAAENLSAQIGQSKRTPNHKSIECREPTND